MTTTRSTLPTQSKSLMLGVSIVVGFLGALGVLFFIIATNQGLLGNSRVTANAIIFVDVPGRIGLDQQLQVQGPAPIPVAAGQHQLNFFDLNPPYSSLPVDVAANAFVYVPQPVTEHYRPQPSGTRGVVHIAAFPPNTTVVIPDCTPAGAVRTVKCQAQHTLTAELAPGRYTVQYQNPHFATYSEDIQVTANARAQFAHSFIATLPEWEAWRQQHGKIIEGDYRYYRYRRGPGYEDAFLLPFEAAGYVVGELFD